MSAGDLVVWPNGGLEFPVYYRERSYGFRWTSPFGMRTHPVTGAPETFHYGLDLIGWSVIKSPYTGTVTFSGYNGGAGNEVRIREDGTGDYVRLMHNSALWVKAGQRVSQGQDVAVMGTTGSSTGVHCHEEIHPGGGAAVDPIKYYAVRNASAAGGGAVPFTPKEESMTLYLKAADGKNPLVANGNLYANDGPVGSWRGLTNLESYFVEALAASGLVKIMAISGQDLATLFAVRGVAQQRQVPGIPWSKGTLMGLGTLTGKIMFPGSSEPVDSAAPNGPKLGEWHYPVTYDRPVPVEAPKTE